MLNNKVGDEAELLRGQGLRSCHASREGTGTTHRLAGLRTSRLLNAGWGHVLARTCWACRAPICCCSPSAWLPASTVKSNTVQCHRLAEQQLRGLDMA